MSDHPFCRLPTFSSNRTTRRQVMHCIGAGIAGIGLLSTGLSAIGQSDATPDASSEASPPATPLPDPVPETSLTIVKDQQPMYSADPVQGTDLQLYVRSEGLHNFSPTAQRQDMQVIYSLYDPLVWINEVTMEPEPWLAESWSWSDDGLALLFQLRDDVSFHDGSPLTAEDVRFSFIAYRDDYDSAMANFFAFVSDVSTEGDHSVRVTFSEPDGAFLFNGASQPMFSSAQYAAYWEGRPVGERSLSGYDWVSRKPIGTGPWQLAGTRDDFLMLGRNDGYWSEPPHFDHLKLIAEDNQQSRIDGWKNGDVDVLYPVRAPELEGLWDAEGALYIAEAPVAFFAAFNSANPANATPDMMRDPALRRALTLAVDRERYARDVFFGFIDEKKAGTITQPWAHEDSISNPNFDIEEANRILDEAGWADINGDGMRDDARGNKLDLYLIVSEQERPELLAIVDGLAEDFQKIGARLTVQQLPPGDLDDRWVTNRMYDMVAFSLVQYPAFAEYDLYGSAWDIRTNRRGWNPGAYSNQTVDAAIEAYFRSWEIADMRSALSELQIAANEDLFGLWFGFPHDLVLARPDVQGFIPNRLLQTYGTRHLWRGEPALATPERATPENPAATPDIATPVASPVVPHATPLATPELATPLASPDATPVS